MSLVNVRRDVTDAFYRYKMERIQTKIEGKGNGIKTVVTNLSSVAQSLARPATYLIKYFGFELGAQTNSDPPDDRWIINGAHESSKLQDYLDGFISKFVLCKKCKNPETVVQIVDGRIWLDCKACGQRTEVDLRLKLSGFILKNTTKKGKKDKAERKAARKAKQNGTANNNKDKDGGSGDDSGDKDNNGAGTGGGGGSDDDASASSPTAAPVSKTETPAAVVPEFKDTDEVVTASANADGEVEWKVEMTAEAIRARQQALPDDFKQRMMLNGGDDDDDDENGGGGGSGGGHTVYDTLGEWIQEQAEAKGGIDAVDDVEIYLKARELGIEGKHRTVIVLVQTLFNETLLAQIPKRAAMLKRMVTSERHEKALLGGTERLVGQLSKDHPDMVDKVPKILHLYYNDDLVSEEVVTKWGTKASRKYTDLATSKKVRKAAEPFLTWLAEAEEEESSEEEDDDEDDEDDE